MLFDECTGGPIEKNHRQKAGDHKRFAVVNDSVSPLTLNLSVSYSTVVSLVRGKQKLCGYW